MSDKIDMSLDDIIKRDAITTSSRKRGSSLQSASRPNFRRSTNARFSNNNTSFASRNRSSPRSGPYFRSQTNRIFLSGINGRLLISNLEYKVSDTDLEELFTSFGPLKKSSIHYDQFGYSLGTAEVIFERKEDAINAMNKYNGVPLDGRPMRIQLIGGRAQNSRPFKGNKSGGRGRGGEYRNKTRVTAEDLDRDLDSWKMDVE